ncbi:MAG: acyl--CoA ligase [Lachnospiraceae bacterium]|nr:acyl--CoA ligase [Lachnospiraceae bacterium]
MDRASEKIFQYKDSNEIAIIDSEHNSITYTELYASCVKLANTLEERNCSQNVMVYTGNSIEYVVALLALWMTDRTAVLIEIKTIQDDICRLFDYFKSDTIILSSLTQIENTVCPKVIVPDLKGDFELSDWKDKPFTNNIAMIFQTSGTTFEPKHVMISHSGIIAECNASTKLHGFERNVRDLLVVPITSSFGTCGLLLPNLYVGRSISLYQGEFNVKKVRKFIRETNTTLVVCTFSILSLIIGNEKEENSDFKSVKYVALAGEVSNTNVFERTKKVFGVDYIVQLYGLTETSGLLAGNCIDKKAPFQSVGKVLNNFKIRIKDGENIKGTNELGEIQVKGESVTCGYYENDELNKNSFDNEWFKTGDIGYIDDEGYLYIKGRIKNIIIVGGKNVYAEEVEKIVMMNENVKLANVYAQKSKITGEKVICEVLLNENCEVSSKDLLIYCKNKMKNYMVPSEFKFVDRQIINTSGKAARKSWK